MQRPEKSDKPTEAAFDAFDDGTVPAVVHADGISGYAKNTGRWIGWFAITVALVLGGTFLMVTNIRARESFDLDRETAKAAGSLPRVDVIEAKPAMESETLTLPAETSAWYRTTIYSRVSGYLDKWNVDIGDRVKKGQILATIDTPDLDSQLDAGTAELRAAEAETKVKESDADFARTSYDRWRDSPNGVVSVQERDAKKAAYDSSNAQLNAARARVNVDRAKLDGLTSLSRFKNVSAPFDGVITERRIDPGDLVTAGSTASTTPLFVIQQSDRIRVYASVPQDAAERLKVGSPVEVTTDGADGLSLQGKIVRTTGALDPKARTMRVEADLANSDYALSPGMYVRMKLHFAGRPGIELPASALIFRTSEPEVAVVGPDNKVQFRKVALASDEGDTVVVGSGIAKGERVVLNMSSQIKGGQQVLAADNRKEAAD